MHPLWLLAYFFGGAFASNAVPHFVAGVLGRPFQSPFAKPPGRGLSRSTVNVVWGFANFVVAYTLLARIGDFHLRSSPHILAAGLGALLMGLQAAHHFGQFHGGSEPTRA